MTTSAPFEQTLVRLEQELLAVTASVESGVPDDLTQACEALRLAAIDLSALRGNAALATAHAPLRTRIQRLADGLAIQREGLIRRLAAVQRSLQILVPAAVEPAGGVVYGQPAMASRFGGAGRRPLAS